MEEMLEKLSVDPATVPEDQADGETPADSGQSDSQEENKDVWGQ
jgi:hypothetical protein